MRLIDNDHDALSIERDGAKFILVVADQSGGRLGVRMTRIEAETLRTRIGEALAPVEA